MTQVYESDVVDSKGRVVLYVVWDKSNFPMAWFNSCQHKVSNLSCA